MNYRGIDEVQWNNVDRKNPVEVLTRAFGLYSPNIALACSFSLEDVVIIDLLSRISKTLRIFALDTGRFNPETYECAEKIRDKYKLKIEWYSPKSESIQQLESEKGLFSFRESLEERKHCCGIRKVEPLSRALVGLKAWVTGMRREQSITRDAVQAVEVDHMHDGIIKINPLVEWAIKDLRDYVEKYNVPYNRLYDYGYQSIGCAPCTRGVEPGQDQRAGRWWWESQEHKECGLHQRKR